MRDPIKDGLGYLVAGISSQCRFDRAIFVLAHMRCGSTSLSNVLCSRSDVSGYGEAHIRYTGRFALGKLVINQAHRRAWTRGAPWLFDKILHSRHDGQVPADFFQAKAIFLARSPGASIRSIRKLFAGRGKSEYQTDAETANYYQERMAALAALWQRFPASNRIGLTYAALVRDPEGELARVSAMIAFDPPLRNEYCSHAASRTGGGGDPIWSGLLRRIERQVICDVPADAAPLKISFEQAVRLDATYAEFEAMIAKPAAAGRL